MTPEQSIECAEIITGVYPNTSGKTSVVNAYARQLVPYPYRFVGEVVTAMPARYEGEFCPTVREILDAMVDRYKRLVQTALHDEAKRVYLTRYNSGDANHEFGFVLQFAEHAGIGDISDETALTGLRDGVRPADYVSRFCRCKIAPREGGPIDPPPPKRKATTNAL